MILNNCRTSFNMKNKEIDFDERKSIQLDMLKEIDAFCRKNDIRYSIAFGTLLGAVRHKGFIPWDDDVDIMMPLPDMIRFKNIFKSSTLKYHDIDTNHHFEFDFSRIANIKTYKRIGLLISDYGISIDLYPLVAVPDDDTERKFFFKRAEVVSRKRIFYVKWRRRFAKYASIKSIPGFYNAIKKTRDVLCSYPYGKSNTYYVIAGPLDLKEKMIYKQDLFQELVDLEFENYNFRAISEYDLFLRMRYGDYMELPPEEQRHPYHIAHFYWKN